MDNIQKVIEKDNISRSELAKFKEILENYQPENKSLYSVINQYIYRNIEPKKLNMFNVTIDALFKSLDYPTEEWELQNPNMKKNYTLVKDSIIEYCITNIKDINTILENVAFLNTMDVEEVKKRMQTYMSSYGDVVKVMNAFSIYSDNYKENIKKSNTPEVYIPIYSKAVVEKINEMKNNKHM